MSEASEKIPALEWFFKRDSAANFPQDTLDINYVQLKNASAELNRAIIDTGLAEKYPSLRMENELKVGNLDSFISKLKYLSDSVSTEIDTAAPNESETLKPKINNALISLVMYAKTSKDTNFRDKVLSLIKDLS
jgi:hypothetical protein